MDAARKSENEDDVVYEGEDLDDLFAEIDKFDLEKEDLILQAEANKESTEVEFTNEEKTLNKLINKPQAEQIIQPLRGSVMNDDLIKLVESIVVNLSKDDVPYWCGNLQETQFMRQIEEVKRRAPHAEYIYGTQFWWLSPDKITRSACFPKCVTDRKSTRLNSSHRSLSRMPSSA